MNINKVLNVLLDGYAKDSKEGRKYFIDHILTACSLYESREREKKYIKDGKEYYCLYSNPNIHGYLRNRYKIVSIYTIAEKIKFLNKEDDYNYTGIVIDPETVNYTVDLKDLRINIWDGVYLPFMDIAYINRDLLTIYTSMGEVLFDYEHGDFTENVYEQCTVLDLKLNLHPGELTIIGGRPCMGKTMFAINIMLNEVINHNGSVLYLNLATHNRDLATRTFGVMSNYRLPRERELTIQEYEQLLDIAVGFENRKAYTVNCTFSNIEEIINIIKENYKKVNPTKIIIDYFQLIHYKNNFVKDESEALYILKQLKKLAKELNVSMIVLSQLDRKLEKRKDLHPKITDIRGAKSAGEIADRVYMLYRKNYYNEHKMMYISNNPIIIDELEVIDVKSKDKKTISYMFNTESGCLERGDK